MHILKHICVLLLLGAIAVHATPAAAAKWPQAAKGDPVTITYSYSNLLNGGLLNKENESVSPIFIKNAVDEALSLWTQVAPLHFVETTDNGPPASDGAYSCSTCGQIRLGHHNIGTPGGVDVKAHAYFPTGSTGFGLQGDVHFDRSNRWEPIGHIDPVTGADYPDILGATIHEVGHSIDIRHSNIDGANMFPRFLRASGPGTAYLHSDDIAAVQKIYGAGVGSVTPLIEPIDDYFDIRPRGERNRVDLHGDRVLRMALLGGEDFNVSQIAMETLRFGDPLLLDGLGAEVDPKWTRTRDINHDDQPDLLLAFRMKDLVEAGALGHETEEGTLQASMFDGTRIAGSDPIHIVSHCRHFGEDHPWYEGDRDHYGDGHGDNWHEDDWNDDPWFDDPWYEDDWDYEGDRHSEGEGGWGTNDHDYKNDWEYEHDWDPWHHHGKYRCKDHKEAPEPSTILLALVGLVTIGVNQRRR